MRTVSATLGCCGKNKKDGTGLTEIVEDDPGAATSEDADDKRPDVVGYPRRGNS